MTEDKRFSIVNGIVNDRCTHGFLRFLDTEECCEKLNELNNENRQLKYENELLSEGLKQCKAVINKRWSEYLQKKGVERMDNNNSVCKDYGLKCFNCSYWNKWSNYCMKFKIWSDIG